MTEPQPEHPVQNRWIVYDNAEHEFSIYYNEQEARKEYDARIKDINDNVGQNDEYEGEEEVYLASVISKAEVVQVGVADDSDEGLYRLISYDHSTTTSAGEVLDELEKFSYNFYVGTPGTHGERLRIKIAELQLQVERGK